MCKKKKHIIYQKREVLILRAIKNINHAANGQSELNELLKRFRSDMRWPCDCLLHTVFEIAYYIHLKIAVLLKEHLKDDGGSADCPDDDPYFFFSRKNAGELCFIILRRREGRSPYNTHQHHLVKHMICGR
jgi:hypothetical protein